MGSRILAATWVKLVPALPVLICACLLLRAVWADHGADPGNRGEAVYDPRGYYSLIRDSVAPFLVYCPVVPDRGELWRLRHRDPGGPPDSDPQSPEDPDAQRDDAPPVEIHPRGAESASEEEAPPGPRSPVRPPLCACPHRLSGIFCLRRRVGDRQLSDLDVTRIESLRRMSWLNEDLQFSDRWERDDDAVSGSGLRLRAGVHQQRLPGSSPTVFSGTVYLRQGSVHPVLVDDSANQHVIVAGPPDAGAEEVVNIDDWLPRSGPSQDLDRIPSRSLHRSPLLLRAGDEAIALIATSDVSNRLVFRAEQSRQTWIRIDQDGVPTNPMRVFGALQQDQVLTLNHHHRELALRLTTERTGVLSELRSGVSGRGRFIDEESGVSDLVRGLVGSIGAATQRIHRAYDELGLHDRAAVQALAQADIWLTLEQVLQTGSGHALRQFMESSINGADVRFANGLWRDRGALMPPPRASMIMLDADRGDILAMGTYPDAAALRRMQSSISRATDTPALLLREHLSSELERASVHFNPHAIGSVFKPLLAWSASEADRSLLAFTVPTDHARDWNASDPRRNRVLDQCLVHTRSGGSGPNESHFGKAYTNTAGVPWVACDANTPPGQEDLCLALARSDTYFFLELGARLIARAHDPRLQLPTGATSPEERDARYDLLHLCRWQPAPNRLPGRVCAPRDGRPQALRLRVFPTRCDGDTSTLCAMEDLLGVLPQAVGGAHTPRSAPTFLGPVASLADAALRPLTACRECPAMEGVSTSELFRWVLPSAPEWSDDLLERCAPEFEQFITGAGINTWNNIHVAQTFARLFTGDRHVGARLVLDAQPSGHPPRQQPPLPDAAEIAGQCTEGSPDPRCRVLRGLSLAVTQGTLARLARVPQTLEAGRGEYAVGLWGKTGTTTAEYPAFVYDRRGWRRALDRDRKSLHVLLLLEVRRRADPQNASRAQPGARHFVVYLAIEGVDPALVSSPNAVPFFRPPQDRQAPGPGYSLLSNLIEFARSQQEH